MNNENPLHVTIFVDKNRARIEVYDAISRLPVVNLKLSAEAFTAALGRLCDVPARGTIFTANSDRFGKKMELRMFAFPMPGCSYDKSVAASEAVKVCPDGWKPDLCFNQGSFFKDNGVYMARTIIRRWVEAANTVEEDFYDV